MVSFQISSNSLPPLTLTSPTKKFGGSELSTITFVLSVVWRTVIPSTPFTSVKSIENSIGPSGSELCISYVAVHLLLPPSVTVAMTPFIWTTGSVNNSVFEEISNVATSPVIPLLGFSLEDSIETIFSLGALTISILSINQSSM